MECKSLLSRRFFLVVKLGFQFTIQLIDQLPLLRGDQYAFPNRVVRERDARRNRHPKGMRDCADFAPSLGRPETAANDAIIMLSMKPM